MACIWVELGEHYYNDQTGWIYTLFVDEFGENANDKTGVWIAAIYWIFTTLSTVGYGDFYPTNIHERLYTMFVEFMGVFVFAYIMSNVNQLIETMDGDSDEYLKICEDGLNLWLMKIDMANPERQLPQEMVNDIKKDCRTYWRLDHKVILNDTFYNELPEDLKKELTDFCFKDVMAKYKVFFKDLEPKFIENFVLNLSPKRMSKNQSIILAGTIPKKFFMISKGAVDVCNKGDFEKYVRYIEGSYFGDYHLLFKVKSSYIFKSASEEVELLYMNHKKFNELCELFPKSAQILRSRAYFRRKFIKNKVNLMKELRYLNIEKKKRYFIENIPEQIDDELINTICLNEGIDKKFSKLKFKKQLKTLIENPYDNFEEMNEIIDFEYSSDEDRDFDDLADEEKLEIAEKNRHLINNTREISNKLDHICYEIISYEKRFNEQVDSVKYNVNFIKNFKEYAGLNE